MDDVCPVCYEIFDDRIRATPPCKHDVCITCLLRIPRPQACPMCRMPLSHMLPDGRAAAPSTLVSVASDDDGTDREYVVEQLAYAVRHLGVAPRNRIISRIPVYQRGTLVNRMDGVVDATGPRIVPASYEEDVTPEPST